MLTKFILICYLVCFCKAGFDYDYFWKDYSGGPVPKNALKLDDKSDVYVGQVYSMQNELFPAAIRTVSPIATSISSNGRTFTSDKHIKILCSQMPENFQWVKANASSYHHVQNLVPSGRFENFGITAYIGRVYVKGRVYLGILGRGLTCSIGRGIHYTQGPFEVLTYKSPNYNCGVICPR